jgi:predicted Zn-ribbon and HTH transcriptional regulator
MITLRIEHGIKRAINKVAAKEYTMENFLSPGLVSYQDSDAGICRLDKEVIDAMLPSFVGCPVTIDHVEDSKAEILNGTDPAVKGKKKGTVTRAWWNAETGQYDCSFTVEDPEAEKAVQNGYSGSCAYNVSETGPAGELHAMAYNETILGGEFEHLALVTNPRYEDCRIKLNGKVRMNSKAGEIKKNVTLQEMKDFREKKQANMTCVECGASFRHSNPSVETRCPKCHGYDVEVSNAKENANNSRVGEHFLVDGVDHICIEDNGDRGKFEAQVKMAIKPTYVWRFADIENSKENAGLDQGPFGSTLKFISGHIDYKGYQIEQVADAKWKVWKGPRFLATLASEQEAKSFIDQKGNSKKITLKNADKQVVLKKEESAK